VGGIEQSHGGMPENLVFSLDIKPKVMNLSALLHLCDINTIGHRKNFKEYKHDKS
jgi:hypothetical protein